MFWPYLRVILSTQKLCQAKHRTQKRATVDPPEECHTGGTGRLLDNICTCLHVYAEINH